eukprot:scaffold1534_cov267-Pinguiococcus_pyrenoidosus.AAC.14
MTLLHSPRSQHLRDSACGPAAPASLSISIVRTCRLMAEPSARFNSRSASRMASAAPGASLRGDRSQETALGVSGTSGAVVDGKARTAVAFGASKLNCGFGGLIRINIRVCFHTFLSWANLQPPRPLVKGFRMKNRGYPSGRPQTDSRLLTGFLLGFVASGDWVACAKAI